MNKIKGEEWKVPKLSGTQWKADTCLRHDLMASLKLTNETPVTMHLLLYARFCLPLPYIICPKTLPGVLSSPGDCSTHRPYVSNKKKLPLAFASSGSDSVLVQGSPYG